MENQKEESNWGLILAGIGILILYLQLNKLLFKPFENKCNVLGFFVILFLNLCVLFWAITLHPDFAKAQLEGKHALYWGLGVYVFCIILVYLVRYLWRKYVKNEN